MTNPIQNKRDLIEVKRLFAIDVVNGTVIWKTDKVFPQHFYPLSIKDYCYALKSAVTNGIDSLPILSISMKDFPYCYFNCVDCLACPSREWAVANGHIKYPIIPIDKYKKILSEISIYSKGHNFPNVRFEICGEGNPDLYKYRDEMIRFASEKCNMGIVYVSTGSMLSEELIDTLVECASCIRISFPGINDIAYATYSAQNTSNAFSYDSAIRLLETLVNKRAKANREKELLIGSRTCLRQLNSGSYKRFIETIGNIGVDAFQGVKVLTPDFASHEQEMIDCESIQELLFLKEHYRDYGIQSFQIPLFLDSTYNNRSLNRVSKPSKCWSSIVSPIMYGTNVIACAHWNKITNFRYHYGVMEGVCGELEAIMHGAQSKLIAEDCPKKCYDCCAYNDNAFMDTLWRALITYQSPENIQFYFEY